MGVYAQFSIAQHESDIVLVKGILNNIYNFNIEQAHNDNKELVKRYPKHPAPMFIKGMITYWEMVPMSRDNPKFYIYRKYLDSTILLAEPMLKDKKTMYDASFFLLSSYSSLTLLHIKAKDYTSALGTARKAYGYMKDGFTLSHIIPDFHFTTGLYYYYAAQFPDSHPIVRPFMWFFVQGNKVTGLENLKLGSQKGVFTNTESTFFYMHVLLKYEEKPHEALEYSRKLIEKYPQNNFYLVRYIESLLLAKLYTQAYEPNLRLGQSRGDFFMAAYYLFTGLLYDWDKHDMVNAKIYYLKCIDQCAITKKLVNDIQSFAYTGMVRVSLHEKNNKKAKEYLEKGYDVVEYVSVKKELDQLKKIIYK
ncbi:MAG: hypothetical protein NW207_03260 [Cytophagales bacterium]|nr:hypothetical protein [Cytophagales bacterium]